MRKRWALVITVVAILATLAAVALARDGGTVSKSQAAPAQAVAVQPAAPQPAAPQPATTEPESADRPPTKQSARQLAGQDCREEAVEDRAEFRAAYGQGSHAIGRCVAGQIREATAECREEARDDALDYQQDYGTGAQARTRCIRDDLS
jgi:hypothetical protein